MLMSRHLRSVLQITSDQLTPKTVDPKHVNGQLKKKQQLHKKYYDQGSRPLNELKSVDPICMQVGNYWIPATVMQKANTPHLYIVRTPEGHTYHRNCRHFKRSHTQEPMSNNNTTTMSLDQLNNDQTNGTNISHVKPPQTATSRGRPVKTPVRLQDYIKL